MAECKHEFIGRTDGIHCVKCGSHMSASEYVKYLHPEIQKNPKTKRNGGKRVRNNE